MELICPVCAARFPTEGSRDEEVVCPACMHVFQPPRRSRAGLPRGMLLEVQGKEGERIGLLDRWRIRQLVYGGRLTGQERAREPGGSWTPLLEREEFRELFVLLGRDPAEARLARQKARGWARDASAREADGPRAAADRTPPRLPLDESPERGSPIAWALIGAGALGVAALAWWAFR